MPPMPLTRQGGLDSVLELRAESEHPVHRLRKGHLLRRSMPALRYQAHGQMPAEKVRVRAASPRPVMRQVWEAHIERDKMRNLIAFNDNYSDNSTEAGFEFTFYCDICHEGYRTRFIPSKTYKKKGFFDNIGRVASIAGQLSGQYNIGYAGERGGDMLSSRFDGMSPAWHKEHEAAFELAQNEARGRFHRCPRCGKWVCGNDWNEEASLCVDDAPRESVEIAAARAGKMKEDIWERSRNTQVFTGEIDQRQAMCPNCGKPAGQGKFCNNCGSPTSPPKCQQCGAENPPGARFCSECGDRLR